MRHMALTDAEVRIVKETRLAAKRKAVKEILDSMPRDKASMFVVDLVVTYCPCFADVVRKIEASDVDAKTDAAPSDNRIITDALTAPEQR